MPRACILSAEFVRVYIKGTVPPRGSMDRKSVLELSFLQRASAPSNPLDRPDRFRRSSVQAKFSFNLSSESPSGAVASPAVSQGRAVNRKNAYPTRENGGQREELRGPGHFVRRIQWYKYRPLAVVWRVIVSSRAHPAHDAHTRYTTGRNVHAPI